MFDVRASVRLILALSFLLTLPLAAADLPELTSPAAEAFARLKSLQGTWKGVTADERAATLEVSITAGGNTVMERFAMDGMGHENPEQSMLTLYHLDGQDLMLTHYCVSNNQPRMRADLSSGEPDVFRFELFDATNLTNPDAGHMYKAKIHLVDESHLTTEWTYREKGVDAYSVPVTYERVR